MRLEEALIDVGAKPLYKSPYSKILNAMLNAYLPGDNPVNEDMTGHQLLSEIYQLKNAELQEKILNKKLGHLRTTDAYRSSLLGFSTFAGIGVVVIALAEVANTAGYISVGGIEVLEVLVKTFLDLTRETK